jgi:hypothetical protein
MERSDGAREKNRGRKWREVGEAEEISRRATTHPGRRVGVYGRIIFGALLLVRDTIFSEI